MKKRNGFTIVELLAVIVLLAIIMMIAVPSITGMIERAGDTYYSSLEEIIAISGKEYFAENRSLLPKTQGAKERVDIAQLVTQKKIEQPVSSEGEFCSGYVEVTKNSEDKMEYKACLNCNSYKTSGCGF